MFDGTEVLKDSFFVHVYCMEDSAETQGYRKTKKKGKRNHFYLF